MPNERHLNLITRVRPKRVGLQATSISPQTKPVTEDAGGKTPINQGRALLRTREQGSQASGDSMMGDLPDDPLATDRLSLNPQLGQILDPVPGDAWDEKLTDPPPSIKLVGDISPPEPPPQRIAPQPIASAVAYSDDPVLAARQRSVAHYTDLVVFYADLQNMLDQTIRSCGLTTGQFDGLKTVFSQAMQDCVSLAQIAATETTALAKAHAIDAHQLAAKAGSQRVDADLDRLMAEIEMLPDPVRQEAAATGVGVAQRLPHTTPSDLADVPPEFRTLYQTLNDIHDDEVQAPADQAQRLGAAGNVLSVADEQADEQADAGVDRLVRGNRHAVDRRDDPAGDVPSVLGVLAPDEPAEGPPRADDDLSDIDDPVLRPTPSVIQTQIDRILDGPDTSPPVIASTLGGTTNATGPRHALSSGEKRRAWQVGTVQEGHRVRAQLHDNTQPSRRTRPKPQTAPPKSDDLDPTAEQLEELKQAVKNDPRNPDHLLASSGRQRFGAAANRAAREGAAMKRQRVAREKSATQWEEKMAIKIQDLAEQQRKDAAETERLFQEMQQRDREFAEISPTLSLNPGTGDAGAQAKLKTKGKPRMGLPRFLRKT